MINELTRAFLFTMGSMLLFGGIYPLTIWGIGRLAFADRAQGSLITRADGSIAGSSLIAQPFAASRYFHPRPSAADYNAASTGGSNFAPSNSDHLETVRERLDRLIEEEDIEAGGVPSEMITASGAGLDPHIPPGAAAIQVARIAAARRVTPDRIRAILSAHVEPPTLGFLGRARVNVLELNLALDQLLAQDNGPTQ
jgi:K+-transporting ATPase ATPase C chain